MASGLPEGLTNYTFPGVLHFLQAQWRQYEKERNEWEIERSDLKAKIALLEGNNRAMENMKQDLSRRVKMLEHLVKQQRPQSVNLVDLNLQSDETRVRDVLKGYLLEANHLYDLSTQMESVHSQPITIESLKTTVVKKANESVKSDAKESTSESTRADSINMDSFTMAELQQDLGLDSPPDDTVEIPESQSSSKLTFIEEYRGHLEPIRDVKTNGKLMVTCSEDKTVKVIKMDTEEIFTLRGHSDVVTCVCLLDEYCFTGSLDASIRVWPLPRQHQDPFGPVILSVHTMIGHSDAVWEMKIHSNGKLLASASADGSVRIWDISNPHTCTIKSTIWYNGFSTGQSGQFVSGTQTPVCLSWYQDLLYVGFKQGGVGVYDIQGQQVKQHLISDTGVLSILALDAVLYCGYESGKLVMYDRSNLEQVLHQSHDAGIESLCSSRGTVVARDQNGRIYMYNIQLQLQEERDANPHGVDICYPYLVIGDGAKLRLYEIK